MTIGILNQLPAGRICMSAKSTFVFFLRSCYPGHIKKICHEHDRTTFVSFTKKKSFDSMVNGNDVSIAVLTWLMMS